MRPSIPSALLLIAYGLLCLLPGGLTLCTHRDGTMRVESAAFPCCCDGESAPPASGQPAGPEAAPSPCSDCVDVPMPSLRDGPCPASANHPRLPDAEASVAALPSALPGIVAQRAERSSPGDVPRSRPLLLVLASTVLRC